VGISLCGESIGKQMSDNEKGRVSPDPQRPPADANPLPRANRSGRIEWIDYAKGICIVLVVMMYAVQWVEDSAGRRGWLHLAVDFAAPFRMPDFFLVSGLLVSSTIGRDWRQYLDGKVVHFVYFYFLWLVIIFLLMGPGMASEQGWLGVGEMFLASFVAPFYMLWFIYLLPIFFVTTKLLRRAPALLVWVLAAVLHVAGVGGDIKVLDKFSQYYVFFYTGYVLAPHVFRFGAAVSVNSRVAALALLAWAAMEGYVAFVVQPSNPVALLLLGFLGAAAIITASAMLADRKVLAWLGYCGSKSLVVYLAFIIPLTLSRAVVMRQGVIEDVGTLSLIVTVASVFGALVLYWMTRNTRFRFLFERPDAFTLSRKPGLAGQGSAPSS